MYKSISKTIAELRLDEINEQRKIVLQPLIDYIQLKVATSEKIRLNFICTHNSRRSHLSQVWAQTLAFYYNINNVFCYSGGTEATALYPMVVSTLQEIGFKINKLTDDQNPIYSIKYSDNELPIMGFSKKMDDDFNPTSQYGAIMTCDSANEACPVVFGSEKRIPVTYEDPKVYDNTDLQQEKYMERSIEIATEIAYVFSQINKG